MSASRTRRDTTTRPPAAWPERSPRDGEQVDMTRHLRRWLNDTALRKFGGTYEGIIADVVEEPIRNRFTWVKQTEPVIVFEDGWRVIPNITMRKTLIEFWGANTEDWIGQRLEVFRHRIEFHDPETGVLKDRWEKRVRRFEQGLRQVAGSRGAR